MLEAIYTAVRVKVVSQRAPQKWGSFIRWNCLSKFSQEFRTLTSAPRIIVPKDNIDFCIKTPNITHNILSFQVSDSFIFQASKNCNNISPLALQMLLDNDNDKYFCWFKNNKLETRDWVRITHVGSPCSLSLLQGK